MNWDCESTQIGTRWLYNPGQMEQASRKPGLIPNRWAAVIGVMLTGFLTAVTVRDAYIHPTRHFYWLFPLDFMLPNWALWLVNGAFYGYLLWLCFVFFRIAQRKERIVVLGCSLGIVLYPIQNLVSTPGAVAIQYVEAAGTAVAFLVALDILLRLLVTDKTRS